MKKWRWLVIVGALVSLGASCSRHDEFQPCPPPGAIGQKTCYYLLTITNKGQEPFLMAKVAKSVIEQNRKKKSELGWFNWTDYQTEDYPFFEYSFPYEGTDYSSIKLGDDVAFVNTPGKAALKKYTSPATGGMRN